MKTQLILAAAVLVALCAGTAKAAEPMSFDFNGTVYTFDRPSLAMPHAPADVVALRYNGMNKVLAKIKLNTRQEDMNDVLFAKLEPGLDVYAVVRELYQAGFKAQAYSDNNGYYFIGVDVSGQDAADRAIGLARYYYVTEVLVGKKVYEAIFPPTQP